VATIIDGKAFSANLRSEIARKVEILKRDHSVTPGLAVVLVGEDPASQVYVRSKGKQTQEAGMNSYEHKLDVDTSQQDLLSLIDELNHDPDVHGILVQLPLPDQIDAQAVLDAIEATLEADRFWVFPGRGTSLGWKFRRFFPRLIWSWIHKTEGI